MEWTQGVNDLISSVFWTLFSMAGTVLGAGVTKIKAHGPFPSEAFLWPEWLDKYSDTIALA